ncbi:uncharacterized protein [Arachis hypogaea]|uniref:uncharacterized protein n=1 Tax=Arachis hypogaea TaxID=3818 RepID=UPI003B224A81
MRAKVPKNFKSPDMDLYDGTIDSKHHLRNFKSRMYLADASDATRCKAFPTTLTKAAMKWFDSLPPGRSPASKTSRNKLIEEELAYNINELTHTYLYTEQKMTHEQRLVFDEILNAVITDSGGFYFFYGHGGCDNTFIWNGLSSAIRSREKIVLNVASSEIASLLLPGGRTTNSRFLILITITDESTCNIKNGSLKAELLIQSSLIYNLG